MRLPSFILLAFFSPLLMTACSNGNKYATTPPPPGITQEQFAKISRYAGDIKTAVEIKMYKPEAYAGKMCTLRVSLQRDGTLKNATIEGGDPGLCKAALLAVTHAKIPPAPDDKTWQTFKNIPMDFKP
ncbi:cell envelope integrity protein TolA [Enterobacter bugandensis]